MISIGIIVGTACLGIPFQGELSGHDADFALRSLVGINTNWGSPGFPPAWFVTADWGFGSAIFQYYPPLSYLSAFALQRLLHCDPVSALLGTLAISRLFSIYTAFLWLRCLVSVRSALIGASAFAVMPFVAFVNPIVRFDFSEAVACVITPLFFWAIHRTRPAYRIFALAIVVAGALLTNIPAAVVCSLCAGFYAITKAWRLALEATAAGLLGVGLACWYILPAALTLNAISTAALPDLGRNWISVLLQNGTAQRTTSFNIVLLFSAAVSLLPMLMLLRRMRHKVVRQVALSGIVAFLATTPLVIPFWLGFPPLHYVEFPWRFLLPEAILSAAALSLFCDGIGSKRTGIAIAASFVFAVALGVPPILYAFDRVVAGSSIRFGSGGDRVAAAMRDFDPWEYIPDAARKAGWFAWMEQDRLPPNVSTNPVVTFGHITTTSFARVDGVIRLSGYSDGPAEVVIPQFWDTNWVLRQGEAKLLLDRDTGLVGVQVPHGSFDLVIERGPTPFSREGLILSFLSVLLAFPARVVRRTRDCPRRLA